MSGSVIRSPADDQCFRDIANDLGGGWDHHGDQTCTRPESRFTGKERRRGLSRTAADDENMTTFLLVGHGIQTAEQRTEIRCVDPRDPPG